MKRYAPDRPRRAPPPPPLHLPSPFTPTFHPPCPTFHPPSSSLCFPSSQSVLLDVLGHMYIIPCAGRPCAGFCPLFLKPKWIRRIKDYRACVSVLHVCVRTFGSTPKTMTASFSNTIPTSFRVGTMFAVISRRHHVYSTCTVTTTLIRFRSCRNPLSAEHSNPAVLT